MTVKVLVCRPDGTQTVELKDIPDEWLKTLSEKE